MRLGVLTGGGDCPGLNAVIRAAVRTGRPAARPPSLVSTTAGGASWRIRRSSSTPRRPAGCCTAAARCSGVRASVRCGAPRSRPRGAAMEAHGLDGLIAIGARAPSAPRPSSPISACRSSACPRRSTTTSRAPTSRSASTLPCSRDRALDRLHTTAESHKRVMVIEVMGRHAGWIALRGHGRRRRHAAHPRDARSISRKRVGHAAPPAHAHQLVLDRRGRRGRRADGRHDGTAGVSGGRERVPPSRGHRQPRGARDRATDGLRHAGHDPGARPAGGTPVAFDRLLATRFGIAAVELAHAGGWGRMVSRKGQDVADVPLREATGPRKVVPHDLYREAEIFFG